ncbi:UDP-glucose 4-epimerase GalE [Helicobacter aurati]|uniref:UDP-glucose 4-epimerase n=1 Tax=Helicobacter aurati TaxID=137778 RepID=A0A3D8J2S6_9HELI|nr:UDP-glucose 4-epimerase GalE [Helicobacter aurati]
MHLSTQQNIQQNHAIIQFLHKANLLSNTTTNNPDSHRSPIGNDIASAPNQSTIFIQASLNDKNSLKAIFRTYNIAAVIHFAAFAYVGESVYNPAKYYRNNIANTVTLLETMQEYNCKKIIFSSTCATYGHPIYLPITESHPQNPINPYGYSKLVVEQMLKDFSRAYGLQYVILRYFNAAGASMLFDIGESHTPETHIIPLVIQTALGKRESFGVFGDDYGTTDGSCIRDYIHVDDLASAHILAYHYLQNGGNCDSFNLSNGRGFSVFEIIECASTLTNQNITYTIEPRRDGDPSILIGDSTKARKILQWNPQFENLQTIIKSALRWHSNARY